MRLLLFTFLLFFVFLNFKAQNLQEIPVLKYEELEKKIQNTEQKLLVVNFWSTTCAPCIKELPDFMVVNEQQKENPDFKMLLVSLDRAKDMERVKRFIKEKNLSAEVIILDDIKRMNTWIPRFQQDWGGEIPVTLFYQNNKKVQFHNGEMSLEELQSAVNQYLTNSEN